jgi:hypothetical protein
MYENDKKLVLKYLFDISNRLDSSDYAKSVDKSLVHKIKPQNVLIHDIHSVDIGADRFEEKFSLYYSVACPNFDCDFIFDHPNAMCSLVKLENSEKIPMAIFRTGYSGYEYHTPRRPVEELLINSNHITN